MLTRLSQFCRKEIVTQHTSNPEYPVHVLRAILWSGAMETTTPATNSACPPAPILPEHATVHASDQTVKSDDPIKSPLTRPRPTKLASQFCDDHDLISLKFLAFRWKTTLHLYCSPKEMQQIDSNTEQALIVPKTLLRVPHLLYTANLWLQHIVSVCPPFLLWISCVLHWHNLLCMSRSAMHDDDDDTTATSATTSSCSSSKHTTRRELPMTMSLLPHIHVTDKRQPHKPLLQPPPLVHLPSIPPVENYP